MPERKINNKDLKNKSKLLIKKNEIIGKSRHSNIYILTLSLKF